MWRHCSPTRAACNRWRLDTDVVDRARTSLRQASLPVLMYGRLKLDMRRYRPRDPSRQGDRARRRLGAGAQERRSRCRIRYRGCTRDVFDSVATTGNYELAKDFVSDSWVLGEGVATWQTSRTWPSDMMRLYEDDYIRVWDALLADLAPRPTKDARELSDMMALLASPTSPSETPARAWSRHNTNLLKPPDASDKVAGRKGRHRRQAAQPRAAVRAAPAAEQPGARVTQHFEALHKLVDGPPGAAPIDQTMHAIGQIQQQLGSMGGGLGSTNALSAVSSQGQADAPRPVAHRRHATARARLKIVAQIGSQGRGDREGRGGTGALATLSNRSRRASATNSLTGAIRSLRARARTWRSPISEDCSDPGESSIPSFADRLAPLVDTSTNPWRWKQGAGGIGSSTTSRSSRPPIGSGRCSSARARNCPRCTSA